MRASARNRNATLLTAARLRAWPLPDPEAAKGKEARGRVLVVGGSSQIPGACLLAGIPALRAGAGKLQVATVREAAVPLGLALPEARVMGMPADANGELRAAGREVLQAASRADALLIGPGMRDDPPRIRLAVRIARACRAPTVFDAGALASCRDCGDAPSIITPHHGEMAALLGVEADEIDAHALPLARAFARDTGAVVVLKASTTLIVSPDGEAWRHTGGSVGLGTSGSGDVLAGLIAGLVARGAEPLRAAAWGVWLHGRAGARLARSHGTVGFLAREIAWSLRLPG